MKANNHVEELFPLIREIDYCSTKLKRLGVNIGLIVVNPLVTMFPSYRNQSINL